MKKEIVLACVVLMATMMPIPTFAEQPYGDNHDHHDVRPPPHHAHHHAAPHATHENVH